MGRKIAITLALCCLFIGGSVLLSSTASAGGGFLEVVRLRDILSQGTTINRSSQHIDVYNYVDGTAWNSGTGRLDVGTKAVLVNPPDAGQTGSILISGTMTAPGGIYPDSSTTKATCDSTRRGLFYTQTGVNLGDAGTRDVTYQCMKSATGSNYAWIEIARGAN